MGLDLIGSLLYNHCPSQAVMETTLIFREGVAKMPQGTIKKLIADRGFGFITGENGDIFFHVSALQGGITIEELNEGQSVSYDEGSGPKGPRAENVQVV